MTTTPTSGAAIQRYKIGYREDEWGQRSSTPGGIPDASGSWVRYEDHIAALAAGQATAAQEVVQDDLITIRKPTTRAEMLWLLKLAHLVISDVDKTLEETFAPAQPAAQQGLAQQEAQEPATVPRFNCWSTNEGDSWFDHPADSQAIYDCLGNDAKVGDEYELTAGWKSVTARYRITEVVGDGEEYEVECISHPHENSAPQSPTAQAAESVPAPQGETNVQLDTDPNPTAPGQQRDMACSLALGQPVGNGSDQVAGHPSAQGDKLLTVAERNIRSFLRSATFKSESDREAALNCVDVLWEAARTTADSVTAVATLHQIMAAARELHAIDNPDGEPKWAALRQCEVDVWRDWAEQVLKAAAAHGQAQTDSVQEDALSDSVRTPLDSLHADAAYLIGRLQLDTMDGARVVEIIRERIEAAKAALAAQAQEAAPVAQGDALTYEQQRAIRQGHEIAASDSYFDARPQIDNNDRRKVFEAGFERGWDAARAQAKKGGA